MITQAKRIRTKKGDFMMFATLDDLEGSVEVVVFGNALASAETALRADSIVLIRGRVDHKERDRTCIVAQQLERFEPSGEEMREARERVAERASVSTPVRLCVDAAALPASALADLKEVLAGFPGECDVVIDLRTSTGDRRLRLGREFRVRRSASLHAELDALLGTAMLSGAAPAAEPDEAPLEARPVEESDAAAVTAVS
jgi:DNA polymerase-3 subunit alpha